MNSEKVSDGNKEDSNPGVPVTNKSSVPDIESVPVSSGSDIGIRRFVGRRRAEAAKAGKDLENNSNGISGDLISQKAPAPPRNRIFQTIPSDILENEDLNQDLKALPPHYNFEIHKTACPFDSQAPEAITAPVLKRGPRRSGGSSRPTCRPWRCSCRRASSSLLARSQTSSEPTLASRFFRLAGSLRCNHGRINRCHCPRQARGGAVRHGCVWAARGTRAPMTAAPARTRGRRW